MHGFCEGVWLEDGAWVENADVCWTVTCVCEAASAMGDRGGSGEEGDCSERGVAGWRKAGGGMSQSSRGRVGGAGRPGRRGCVGLACTNEREGFGLQAQLRYARSSGESVELRAEIRVINISSFCEGMSWAIEISFPAPSNNVLIVSLGFPIQEWCRPCLMDKDKDSQVKVADCAGKRKVLDPIQTSRLPYILCTQQAVKHV
ncbi:hypothetical protein K438DRAFT_1770704 [Mycena galopus ATCC 62051]|nr:hypothetical protein K438DRAFT_1770704 [Mycena galopus ATCC 62051]